MTKFIKSKDSNGQPFYVVPTRFAQAFEKEIGNRAEERNLRLVQIIPAIQSGKNNFYKLVPKK